MMGPTYYEILEVSEQATLDVINAAWKVLMRRFHTDGSEPNEERARLVNQAHDVLENPENRRKYDLGMAQERAADARIKAQEYAATQFAQMPQAYPSAYPQTILEMAAQHFGAQVLHTIAGDDPLIRRLLQQMLRRDNRA